MQCKRLLEEILHEQQINTGIRNHLLILNFRTNEMVFLVGHEIVLLGGKVNKNEKHRLMCPNEYSVGCLCVYIEALVAKRQEILIGDPSFFIFTKENDKTP